MKTLSRLFILLIFVTSCLFNFSCRKDKFLADPGATLQFSQDSILFDTVFTTIGSSTRNFRIRNVHNQKIKISSIFLEGGAASQFKINVDGTPGTSFNDLEIAAKDSMYVFVQVNVNPTNSNSPLIISDALHFNINGNEQKVILEAWGQDAYYHRPDSAIKFKDGTYLPYSLVNSNNSSYTMSGGQYIFKNDKPHVVYGYLVVDEGQKLQIPAGTRMYMNYKSGLWVYAGGQLQVLGSKGNEVIFQGARREKEFSDDPGQWDRIWINEGSDLNIIDHAIIKNGYIGIQCELFGDDSTLAKQRQLTLTNTKIQNMSLWGLYCLAYKVYGGNNVISNCQEHSVFILLGGAYKFLHCTFVNFWSKPKAREKPAVLVNNYTDAQTAPINFYMGNCVVDGRLDNEFTVDIKDDNNFPPIIRVQNSWLKTTIDTSDPNQFTNNRIGDKNAVLKYKDLPGYDFEPPAEEDKISNFVNSQATTDAQAFPTDINGKNRNVTNVTAGAYQN